jgi:mono/diheme cytochrome c family protein
MPPSPMLPPQRPSATIAAVRSSALSGRWLITVRNRAYPARMRSSAARLFVAAPLVFAAAGEAPADPGVLFENNCTACHGNPATRAPSRASLHAMSPDFIVEALTTGIMTDEAAGLTAEQRVAIAEFLTDRKVGAQQVMAGRCDGASTAISATAPSFNR